MAAINQVDPIEEFLKNQNLLDEKAQKELLEALMRDSEAAPAAGASTGASPGAAPADTAFTGAASGGNDAGDASDEERADALLAGLMNQAQEQPVTPLPAASAPPPRQWFTLPQWPGRGASSAVLLVLFLVVSLAGMLATLALESRLDATQMARMETGSRLTTLSERVPRQSRESVLGDESSFHGLEESKTELEDIIHALDGGEPLSEGSRSLLERLRAVWTPILENTDAIVSNRGAVLAIRTARDGINDSARRLHVLSDEVVSAMVLERADQSLVNLAGRQGTLVQQIRAAANEAALGGAGVETVAAQMVADADLYNRTVRVLSGRVSPAVRTKLEAAQVAYREVGDAVGAISANVVGFLAAQQAAGAIAVAADSFLDASRGLSSSLMASAPLPYVGGFVPVGVVEPLIAWLPWLLGGLSIVIVVALVRTVRGHAQIEVRETTEAHQRTQEAIMKLLDEMSSLADGDLTIQTEVTDEVTGAVADSVNYAVEEMRNLVLRIKQAAEQVNSETRESRDTAENVATAADRQLEAINEATREIEEMAASMATLSQDATQFTEVARSSRDVARRGATSVRQTIEGMNDMRRQIQETAKRIKRLGESSQQINEIVSLITDIAAQTNVLSMNASIQAAMAGEAGRGFAVVADEVQRLADRSGDASRQINELVGVIQRDTNDAVGSMEQATREVVEGTSLADAAGRALAEIESESEQLTTLIQETAEKTLEHSRSATGISSRMGTIRVATGEAVQGVRDTAQSIGKLDNVAQELQESVAGFRV